MRSCKLPSGAEMPVFGIGTWRMGESARRRPQELEAVKYALELDYPMIDTAEMYGDGGAEEIVGEALQGIAIGPSSSARSIRTMPRARARSPPASAASSA